MNADRRYDIDWLRVISIGLLIIYHVAIVFQPWAVFIGFIQSNESWEKLWIPMSMLNVWRIPLLFCVSGMGVYFAMRKRTINQLIIERIQRILIPFIFGVIVIVPLHLFVWQKYYNQDINYIVNPSHLWFLANIFIYVLLLSPILFYLKSDRNNVFINGLKKIFKKPISILIIAIPFIIESEVVNPENYELYAMTWHGFFLGYICFLSGFIFIAAGETFWATVLKWRWLYFGLAISLYMVRLLAFELRTPNFLMAAETVLWIICVFGFAYKYLNKPNKALQYLSQSAYPIYILHMIYLYLGSTIILPLNASLFIKFVLVIIFTTLSSLLTFELLIKRIKFIRPLFGLKTYGYNKIYD